MKLFIQSLISWWLAIMVPIHAAATTLTERENIRKRRLLSFLVGFSCFCIVAYLAGLSFTLNSFQLLVTVLDLGILLFALWLNRQGHLKSASLLFFLVDSCSTFVSAHAGSSSDPFLLLWTCFFMVIFLIPLGLFLPPWTLFLVAITENLVVFWYLLVVCHDQLVHLLSPQSLASFLIYLCMIIYGGVLVGILYAVTTKRAIIKADRAADLEAAYATIERQALTDGLTGLPNHRAVVDQLHKELEHARRYGRPFSVLFFDADRFKQVNDTYGHAAGDAILRQIGERTGNTIRRGDTLGRFGGEEFVILLPEADSAEANLIAERIRASVAGQSMNISELPEGISMTISIGSATYPGDGTSEEKLLSQADEAMYVAKRLGRNQVRTSEEARQMGADVELMALLVQDGQREAAAREDTRPEQLRRTYTLRIIYSLLALLEHRDTGLSAHAHAVSDLATKIAQAMEMSYEEVTGIGMAALLHDFGKTSSFSSSEQATIAEHFELGVQVLEANPFLHDLRPAVRHLHEHWDGHGYPDQLQGKDIPLAARIIAVAEAYEAMYQALPYQARHNAEDTLKEVQRYAGTHFDPVVVEVLSELLLPIQQHNPSVQLIG